ncbi:rRNA (guanine-N(1)-)-methyltransferase [Catenovulum agarivorans DS-2]|uniref:rRNA (Guanine-N(1)-)-methyltransferase n=1 Tax=Catenovulum agarivorans DS-2 TaxID=1328313 RepID=W7Q981_9ALTE|nr:methyltransferase domain-containing protein [Catenovulum agarivorans]EWH09359.1 rRNA (guanine-N(1)-)-methyltransferase [Catenovulum agarivorans DS-2]
MSVNLICPLDGELLIQAPNNKFVSCVNKHNFDYAKQGYLNLLPVQFKRSKQPGDDKTMVEARCRFLNSGVYQQIALSVVDLCLQPGSRLSLLDAGCGEGYYLRQFAQQVAGAELIGLDISKEAIISAARQNRLAQQNVQYLVASNKSIPIADNSLSHILCMFGFPVYCEFARKLDKSGQLVLVESGENHLIELRQAIYPEVKPFVAANRQEAINAGFKLIDRQQVQYTQTLNNQQIQDLLIMTPHGHKASADKLAQLQALQQFTISIDADISIWQKEVN